MRAVIFPHAERKFKRFGSFEQPHREFVLAFFKFYEAEVVVGRPQSVFVFFKHDFAVERYPERVVVASA